MGPKSQRHQPAQPGRKAAIVRAVLPALALLLCLAPLSCGSERGEPYRESAEIMGTTFSVTIDAPKASTNASANAAAKAAESAFEEIRRIDRLLSTYKENSEISDVNRRAHKEPVAVGDDFRVVAAASRRFHELSRGRFDPSVYPLMRLWGFTRKQGRVPTEAELAETLPLVDFGKVALDEEARSIGFGREGMALDFGGIAKGYSVDRAVGVLKKLGVENAIIDAGGNFYALGKPEGRESWQAGIRHPLRGDEIIARLSVKDMGMATSGNYERFFEIDGKKYCHIMDPRIGRPVELMLSVTVIAQTAMEADALSTAVFVLGGKEGMQLVESLPEVEAIIMVPDSGSPGGFRIILSSGLAEKVELLLPASS